MPSIFQKIDEFSARPLRSCAEAGKFLDLDSRSIRRLVQSSDLLAIRYTDNGAYKVLTDSAICLFLRTVALAWTDGARLPYDQETFTRYLEKFGSLALKTIGKHRGYTERQENEHIGELTIKWQE